MAALVNPVGPAPEAQTITVLHASPAPVDLRGWHLADHNQQTLPLPTGPLPPGTTQLRHRWGSSYAPRTCCRTRGAPGSKTAPRRPRPATAQDTSSSKITGQWSDALGLCCPTPGKRGPLYRVARSGVPLRKISGSACGAARASDADGRR